MITSLISITPCKRQINLPRDGVSMERRKYLGHYDNACIKSIDSRIIRIDETDIVGYVALVRIQEVNYPRMVASIYKPFSVKAFGTYFACCPLPEPFKITICDLKESHSSVVNDIM